MAGSGKAKIRLKINIKTEALNKNLEQLIKEESTKGRVSCIISTTSSQEPETILGQERSFQYLEIILEGQQSPVYDIFTWLLEGQKLNKLKKQKRFNTLEASTEVLV